MGEDDFLRRIDYINRHNKMVRLKKDNKQKDEKIKMLSEEGKKLIDEFGQKNKKNLEDLNNRIKILEEETTKIKQERNYYKESLESIPPFIRKIFIKCKRSITE